MKIELNHVCKTFKANKVLNDVTLTFEKGHIYGLQGDNGSGKTVILKIIAGFLSADKGNVYQDGAKIRHNGRYIQDAGIVIEKVEFLPFLTLLENLKLLKSFSKVITDEKIDCWINYYQLNAYKNTPYKSLSLGTKQKMALIQAFIHEPTLLLLDEPMNALDVDSVNRTKNYILKCQKDKIVIMTSHMTENIQDLCDICYLVKEGKVFAVSRHN